MPEQRENSVLFSLKELRRIEDDRLRQEESEARARLEAERKAREDAERRAREEIERRRQEEEDRVKRAEQDKINREREEQIRLQETERRARVEAEMRLQEERIRIEAQSRKHKTPTGLIAGVVVVAAVAIGGVAYKIHSDAEAEKIALQQKQAEETERIKREADEKTRKLEKTIEEKEKQMKLARTEEERVRLRNEIEHANQERRRAARPKAVDKPETPPPAAKPVIRQKRQINDDPLEGLKL
jgi:hypothetical protein